MPINAPHDIKKITGKSMASLRLKLAANQTDFWSRLGVTQSAGSRYESGRFIPKPVCIAAVHTYKDEIAKHRRSIFR